MHNPLRPLAALLFAATLAQPAMAFTIDNFEEGDYLLVDTTVPAGVTFSEQSPLDPSNAVGGVRLARAHGTAGATATSTLTTTGGDDGAVLTNAGPVNSLADFAFIYDGVAGATGCPVTVPPTLLCNNGNAGTLNLDLTGVPSIDVQLSTSGVSAAFIRVQLWDTLGSSSSSLQPLTNGGNSILIDGTLLLLDLTDINAILVAVVDLNPGETVTVSHISTVPEPGTAFLMAVGLVGLAIRRTRSR